MDAEGVCACGRPRDRKPDGTLHHRCPLCGDKRAQRDAERDRTGPCSCGQPRDPKPDGTLHHRCPACRTARKLRHAELVAQGGCRTCYYRKALPGEVRCERCRDLADARSERARSRKVARDSERAARHAEAVAARKAARDAARAAREASRPPVDEQCAAKRCHRPRDVKPDGTLYAYCGPCRERRNKPQRRLLALGGCRRCAHRVKAPGDFLYTRCRSERDEEKELRRIAREVDQWAAKPETKHRASGEHLGVSKWNARPETRPADGTYWRPEPDPHRELDPEWDPFRRFRRC